MSYIIKKCLVPVEECHICFEEKEMIAPYYNHRTCFECWMEIVSNHIFQELHLDYLEHYTIYKSEINDS